MSHYDEEREQYDDKQKTGRPRYQIDYQKLDAMCAIHCTGEECAAILGVDYDTLNRGLKRDGKGSFADYFSIKSANGKMSLRRKQFEKAQSGDNTMLIWLGKQVLGQAEKTEERKGNIADETFKTDNKWTVEFINADTESK